MVGTPPLNLIQCFPLSTVKKIPNSVPINNKPAICSFKNAQAVEEIHHGLYSEALNAVKAGSDLPETKIYVCSVCGNTVNGAPPDKCPVCNAAGTSFFEVD